MSNFIVNYKTTVEPPTPGSQNVFELIYLDSDDFPEIKSTKYNLSGEYLMQAVKGNFYQVTKGEKTIYVPENDAKYLDGFLREKNDVDRVGEKMIHTKSLKYGLDYGQYKIKAKRGTFYEFTKVIPVTYVPGTDMSSVSVIRNGNARSMEAWTRKNNNGKNNNKRNKNKTRKNNSNKNNNTNAID